MRKVLAAFAAAIVLVTTAAAGVAVAQKVYNIPTIVRSPEFSGSIEWKPA